MNLLCTTQSMRIKLCKMHAKYKTTFPFIINYFFGKFSDIYIIYKLYLLFICQVDSNSKFINELDIKLKTYSMMSCKIKYNKMHSPVYI